MHNRGPRLIPNHNLDSPRLYGIIVVLLNASARRGTRTGPEGAFVTRSASKTVYTDTAAFAVWSPPPDQKDAYLDASYRCFQALRDDPALKRACRVGRSWRPRWLMSRKEKELLPVARRYRAQQDEAAKLLASLGWARGEDLIDDETRWKYAEQGTLIPIELASDCSTELQLNVTPEPPEPQQNRPNCHVLRPYWLDARSGLLLGNGIEYIEFANDALVLEVPPDRYEARVAVCYPSDDWREKQPFVDPDTIRVDLWPLAPGRTIVPARDSVC